MEMFRGEPSKLRRRGAIALQAGFTLTAMIGMAACAIDFGWILLTKTQLQAAADSSALAAGTSFIAGLGPNRLDANVILTAARQYASDYAGQNRNGEFSGTYANTSRDVTLGWASYNASTGVWTKNLNSQLPNGGGYNLARVVLHRDQTASSLHDKPLPLILGPAIGTNVSNLSAVASAVAVPAMGVRIEPESDMTANLIPFTYRRERWSKFQLAQRYYTANNYVAPNPPSRIVVDMNNLTRGWYDTSSGLWYNPPAAPVSGAAPTSSEPLFGRNVPANNGGTTYVADFADEYKRSTTGTVEGLDRELEVNIYPNDQYTSGNFGTVDIGSPGNSTEEVKRQILTGVNASDLAWYPNNSFTLPRDTGGDTGISAGFKEQLAAIAGQCRSIPLFTGTVDGNGNNAEFYLVAFSGIRIMHVDFGGDDKKLMVQSCNTVITGGIGDYSKSIDITTTAFAPLTLIE